MRRHLFPSKQNIFTQIENFDISSYGIWFACAYSNISLKNLLALRFFFFIWKKWMCCFGLNSMETTWFAKSWFVTNGLFGLRGKGGKVDRSKVKHAKNMLILDKFYFSLPPPPQSKQTLMLCLDWMKEEWMKNERRKRRVSKCRPNLKEMKLELV